jgi:DNA-binding MarR family transcriptional regulator
VKPSAGAGAKRSAGPGRKRAAAGAKPSAGVGAKLAPTPTPTPTPDRATRARRGQGEIEALRGQLLAAITEQPGRRTEDINAALGTRTTEIAPVLRRLVADKLVRTEGARRGMRYFAVTVGDGQNGRRAAAAASSAAAAVAAEAAAGASAAAEEPQA